MSHQQLADKVGVTRPAVIGWEKGERNPKRPNIEALSEALGVPLNDLLLAANLLPIDAEDDLTRVLDSQEREVLRYLRGMPPEIRDNAVEGIRLWSDAGERLREAKTERSTGKAADREENPTLLEDSEAGRAATQAAIKARKQSEEDDKIFDEARALMEDDPEASMRAAIAAVQAEKDQKKARR